MELAMTKKERQELEYLGGILYEKFHSQIELVIESVQASEERTNGRINEFKQEMNQKMSILEMAIRGNKTEIVQNGQRIELLEGRMGTVEGRLGKVEGQMVHLVSQTMQ